MADKLFTCKTLSLLSHILLKTPSSFNFITFSKISHATHSRFHKFNSLIHNSEELSNATLIFDLESVLLRSSSLFPYFMLVAFEAGGLLRAFILFLLYPLVWLIGEERAMKVMVFVSFFGIKRDKFRIGSSVLHKFLLEDVGNEGFKVVMESKRKIAVSDMPRVMIECFLKEYLGVDAVVGRELKVFCGYFVGFLEDKKETVHGVLSNELLGDHHHHHHHHNNNNNNNNIIGVGCPNRSLDNPLFSYCKDIYLVNQAEKRNWKTLPRDKYPKPLIFHDGRLAFRPTPLSSLVMFMWLPFGIFVLIIRFTSGVLLPLYLSNLVNAFLGYKTTISVAELLISSTEFDKIKPSGVLYVCNHRTLLDPIFLSFNFLKPLTAVTYSMSRFNEVVSPIKTVRLTRDREKDKKLMEQQLSQGDLVVCPEGTTCREPYLLRFSPLFAELTDEIVPVAIDMQVSMFYGSTASGFKCLDSLFNLLNPLCQCTVKILEKLPCSDTCNSGGKSKIEVANIVQKKIAEALGFECTTFTRKEKYMILAGNEGIV